MAPDRSEFVGPDTVRRSPAGSGGGVSPPAIVPATARRSTDSVFGSLTQRGAGEPS